MAGTAPFRHQVLFWLTALFSLVVVWPVVMPLGTALVLAFLSERPLFWLQHRLRVRSRSGRYWAAASLIVFSLLVIIIPLGLTVLSGLRDAAAVLAETDIEFTGEGGRELWRRVAAWISEPLQSRGFDFSAADVAARLRGWGTALGSRIATFLGNVLAATPQALFDLLILLVGWLVFAVEGRDARKALLRRIIPWDRERRIVAQTTAGVIRSVFVANAAVSLVQALIAGIVLAAVGFPRATILGLLAFFASFIPMLGTALILAPCGLYFLFNDRPVRGIIILVSAGLVGLVDNFLRPFFMKGGLELGFFWILIAFVGGIASFGISGALIGPLTFSLFLAFWRMLASVEEGVPPSQASVPGLEESESSASTKGVSS